MIQSPASLKNRIQSSGLTLLETLLSLVIGAVIILGVLMYYQTASDKSKAMATIKIVGDIGDAVRAYAQTPYYKPAKSVDLTYLVSLGLLSGSDAVNPWTGTIVVSTSGNYLGISINNIPASQVAVEGSDKKVTVGTCAVLAAQLSRSLPLPSPGTVTLTNYTYTFSNPTTGGVDVTQSSNGGGSTTTNYKGAAVCDYTTGTTGTLNVVMDLS